MNKMRLFLITAIITVLLSGTEKEYTVAIDAEYAPYEFVDMSGQVTGFTVSLLNEIGYHAGISFRFVPMSWPEAVDNLNNGNVDLINMMSSPERSHLFEFSLPHSTVSQAIFQSTRFSEIIDVESLEGHRIAFQQNDISLEQFINRDDFSKIIVKDKEKGFLSLNSGNIDAFFAAEQPGLWLTRKYKLNQIQLAQALGVKIFWTRLELFIFRFVNPYICWHT